MRLNEESKRKLESISKEIEEFLSRKDLDMVTAVDILGRARNTMLGATTSKWDGFIDQMVKLDEIYSFARKTAEKMVLEALEGGEIKEENSQFSGKLKYISIVPIGYWRCFRKGIPRISSKVPYDMPENVGRYYLNIEDFSPDGNGKLRLNVKKEGLEDWISRVTDFLQNEMEEYAEGNPGEEISWEFPEDDK